VESSAAVRAIKLSSSSSYSYSYSNGRHTELIFDPEKLDRYRLLAGHVVKDSIEYEYEYEYEEEEEEEEEYESRAGDHVGSESIVHRACRVTPCRLLRYQCITCPPSTFMVWPVMFFAWEE
jgi:hypothetical protein